MPGNKHQDVCVGGEEYGVRKQKVICEGFQLDREYSPQFRLTPEPISAIQTASRPLARKVLSSCLPSLVSLPEEVGHSSQSCL